jgi:hypothetical protein
MRLVDRYQGVSRPSIGHIVGRTCQYNGIEHRLTTPDHPWINGQAERMTRAIKEATSTSFHDASIQELRGQMADWRRPTSWAKPLKALKFRTPYEAIAARRKSKPDAYNVRPTQHLLGPNTQRSVEENRRGRQQDRDRITRKLVGLHAIKCPI